MGVVYNVGRFLGAGAPYLIGFITDISGIELALSSISIAFLVAAFIAMGLHETKSACPHIITTATHIIDLQSIPRSHYLDGQRILEAEENASWQSNQFRTNTTAFNRI